MKLDAHQHFWEYNSQRDTWIEESMGILKKNFLPLDLAPLLKQNKIEGCIAVQADQSEEETQFLLGLANQYPFIKGVVGWVDLCSENVEERLDLYSQNTFFKGVRHLVQSEKEGFLLRPDFQSGIGKLSTYKLTYDLLIFPNQLEEAIQLVERFPSQKFVLDHMAKPNIKKKQIRSWQKQIEQLGKASNVSCKISGLITEADLVGWKSADFTPYLDTVFKAFGENRVLFGSDWPVCLLAGNYEQVIQLIANYASEFSSKAKEKLFGGNAVTIYNIAT